MKPIYLFILDMLLAGVLVFLISSCSTPGNGASPGQQAVMVSALHRVTDVELQQQKVFMQAFLSQHPTQATQ